MSRTTDLQRHWTRLAAILALWVGVEMNSHGQTVLPGIDWQEASPESQGVDSAKLQAVVAYMDENSGPEGAKELVIVRNGYLIWKGPDCDAYHEIYSATKVFTSTVLGLLVADGKCTLDTLAVEHLPDLDDRHPVYAQIRLRHLASMTGGYHGKVADVAKKDQAWGDPIICVTTPDTPEFEPAGSQVAYNDHDVHLLGRILATRVACEPLKDIFQRRIADPIGMSRWDWGVSGTVDGVTHYNAAGTPARKGNGGIQTTARELARLGLLYLSRGSWNGRQLLPASFVDEAGAVQVPATTPGRSRHFLSGAYGFYWWTNGEMATGKRRWPSAPPKTYSAHGHNGNFCYVIPEWNMVVVRLGRQPIREGVSGLAEVDQLFDTFFGKLAAAVGQSKPAGPSARKTEVSIRGDAFCINGCPTYEGRTSQGKKIEGLLFNSRMVQGIFDDLNPETSGQWAYPDTGRWDAERNTREFIAAMPEWRRHGLLAFTLNLQGGSPQGYSKDQPWHNSAITEEGELRPDYMARLERILDRADELGMVVILGIFYFGQDQRLKDEAAVLRGLNNVIDWVLDRDYRNVLVEVNNECNVRYDHAILKPDRVHELIERVKARQRNGRRLLVSTSYGGKSLPRENVVRSADFLLLHGNSISNPDDIAALVRQTRRVPGYRPMPILFNEDDHFHFDQARNNLLAALGEYAAWGYFDYRMSAEGFDDGYQSVPVNWGLSSDRKRAFFAKLAEITGCAADAMAFPGKDWEETTPASQGVAPDKLRAAIEYLERQSGAEGVKRLVIVRHGRMIFRGPEADWQQPVASVTKAFTSTAHGLLIEDGKCMLDTLAKDFNPALAQHYSTVTLRHFATMTSGFDGVGGTYDCDAEKKRCDANALVDPLPPVFAPGTKFMYWDEATQQYGYTLTQFAGESLDDYLRRRILFPIGITRFAWRPDATGKVLNWTGGIEVSASDLARFGHLFLNRGNWNGQQLVSASWVREATKVQVPPSLPSGQPTSDRQGAGVYGYHWWPNGIKPDDQRHWPDAPLGTFARSGFRNNILFVIPEWNMVIARLSPDKQERKITADEYNLFLKKLGEAILPPAGSGKKRTGATGAFEAKHLPDGSGQLSLSPRKEWRKSK